ncbi:MAG: C10 family peptidase [Porphyromonas sp.]|nr:C10 family peptidase [Porphyromonas sp.]
MSKNSFFWRILLWGLFIGIAAFFFGCSSENRGRVDAQPDDSVTTEARHLTIEEARALAIDFIGGNDLFESGLRSGDAEIELAFAEPKEQSILRSTDSNAPMDQYSSLPAYYVFNIGTEGYVVVSAWDVTFPILGFSAEGNFFDEKTAISGEVPEAQNVMSFLSAYANSIDSLRQVTPVTKELKQAYRAALRGTVVGEELRANYNIAPLLGDIKWNQSPYYNAYCPPGTPVGCVATATTQIMRYWKYPPRGTGSHTSTHDGQYANFNKAYNWANMPAATLRQPNHDIAQLSYDVAVGLNMQFSRSGSGTWQYYVPNLLVKHFYYKNTARDLYRSNFNTTDWTNIIYNELANKRPVQYAGSGNGGGHSFVCDGYYNGYFHINWGWGGMSDGYFLLHALDPNSLGTGGGSGGFNYGQDAVVGIEPNVRPTPEPDPDPTPTPTDDYCSSSGRYAQSTYIAQVALNGMNNVTASNAGGYNYFKYKNVEVAPGETYNITLKPGSISGSYREYWRVWIDFNGDKQFTSDEMVVDMYTSQSNVAVTKQIAIPARAKEGNTRMRVSMKWGASPNACEVFDHGEVEDYPVTIKRAVTPEPEPDPDPVVDPYPLSYARDSKYAYISSVNIGNMYNSYTRGDQYASYVNTHHITGVPGRALSFNLTPTFGTSQSYWCYWRIWIDYNKDGRFDSSELVTSKYGYRTVSGWFTLPYRMEPGLYRVRVSMKMNDGYPAPDEIFNYGEVEDYRLRIN